MIGLMFILIVLAYIALSIVIVSKVYKKFATKKSKYIAIAIMVLIPIWDIVLGYPIYKLLCWSSAGVHIYKTVDNVEGFYVGKDSGRYSKIPPLPYKGYTFIEYKRKQESKEPYRYYRISWVDANMTENCIQIGNASSKYNLNFYKQGKCIVKKEISESEVSPWEYNSRNYIKRNIIPVINIRKDITFIRDRSNNQNIAENITYTLDQNWVLGIIKSSIVVRGNWAHCDNKVDMLQNTLKTKKEER